MPTEPELYADIREDRRRRRRAAVASLALDGFRPRHRRRRDDRRRLRAQGQGARLAPKAPPFIAAAQGPTKVQPPSDATVSTPNDAGASLLKDNTQLGRVKVVDTEEQPVDLHAQTAPPPSPGAEPRPSDLVGSVRDGTVDTPVVVADAVVRRRPAFRSSPSRSRSGPSRCVRTGRRFPSAAAASADPSIARPPRSRRRRAKACGRRRQPPAPATSTPKIDLPTKLSAKSSARVVVAKTDTTAPAERGRRAGAARRAVQARQVGRKPAKVKPQPKRRPRRGAGGRPSPPRRRPAAGRSSSPRRGPRRKPRAWSPKLNEKYASALGGAALGVHKATVKGDTVYRVRVDGPLEGRRRGDLRAGEGRRRPVLRHQVSRRSRRGGPPERGERLRPMPKAFIAGCAGLALAPERTRFLPRRRSVGPDPLQAQRRRPRAASRADAVFRDCVGRADAPVLIDQEGGRVQRMGPPHWPAYPAAGRGHRARIWPLRRRGRGSARRAPDRPRPHRSRDHRRLRAGARRRGARDPCGDRSPAPGRDDPERVAALGRAFAEGCSPAASRRSSSTCPATAGRGPTAITNLPVVEASREALEARFRAVRGAQTTCRWR